LIKADESHECGTGRGVLRAVDELALVCRADDREAHAHEREAGDENCLAAEVAGEDWGGEGADEAADLEDDCYPSQEGRVSNSTWHPEFFSTRDVVW
jgi:hypothetical protein